jgi:hypothetical protein
MLLEEDSCVTTPQERVLDVVLSVFSMLGW